MSETVTSMDDLVARARGLVESGRRALLGLVGAPGAGKSTVSAALVEALGPQAAVVVPMDGFHLANAELARLGRSERKGAIDTFDGAGYVALMRRLRARAQAYAPCSTSPAPRVSATGESPLRAPAGGTGGVGMGGDGTGRGGIGRGGTGSSCTGAFWVRQRRGRELSEIAASWAPPRTSAVSSASPARSGASREAGGPWSALVPANRAGSRKAAEQMTSVQRGSS